jgi:hypothetical protein
MNNVGNCIIGDVYKTEIEIFDDNNIGDIFTYLIPSIYSNYLNLQQKEGMLNYYKVYLNTKIITCNITINFDDNLVNKKDIDKYFIILYLTKSESDKNFEISKKINYVDLNKFEEEINYEELTYNMNQKGEIKILELRTSCCSSFDSIQTNKIFKMEFFN